MPTPKRMSASASDFSTALHEMSAIIISLAARRRQPRLNNGIVGLFHLTPLSFQQQRIRQLLASGMPPSLVDELTATKRAQIVAKPVRG